MCPPARTLAWLGFALSLAAVSVPAAAQTSRRVSGTVSSTRDSTPLADVFIRLLETRQSRSTSTNAAGRFKLEAPTGPVRIVAARIGFVPESVLVATNQSELTIRLRPTVVELDTLTVTGRADDLIGIASSASQGRVGASDLRSRPIAREGELLETVPGVIVTQHSGDGKANQYFIRGFNLDHGTDFSTRIEGMPVNMVSHAHGQGYTDLNFLIPELVDYLDYRLGVYHSELGDFGSAGGAEFHLARTVSRPFAGASTGEDGAGSTGHGGIDPCREGGFPLWRRGQAL